MTHDPESALLPLRAAAGDLAALRSGAAGSAAVVRVARAAETTLRRMLRDDPTVPVETRLRALSPDDLPADELLAVLRRRDRLPMELAAAFHELVRAALRIAGGAEAGPRDVEVALAVADGLDRQARAGVDAPLEDPVLTPPEETFLPADADDEGSAHPVPPLGRRGRPVWPFVVGLIGVILAALLATWLLRRDDARLAQGEALLREGETAAAARAFRDAAERDPDNPLPRLYLAQIFREAGRLDLAAAEMRKAAESAPDDPRVKTEMGALLLESGRPDRAVAEFNAALKGDRESARAWGGLVRALREAGRPAEAQRALAQAPPEVRALMATVDSIPRAAPVF